MQIDKFPKESIKDLQQKNRELLILHTIAEGLNREFELNLALDNALLNVLELFKVETGWIWLLDQDSLRPYLAASHHLPPALSDKPSKMEGICFCLESFIENSLEEAINISAIECSRLKNLTSGTGGLKFHSSVPITANNKKIGMLNVASKKLEKLSENDLNILYTIGDMIALAVERATLYKESTESGSIRERNRLAREIHDTISQGLAGLILQLETAESILDNGKKNSKVRDILNTSLELARGNLEEARRSVQDLRSIPLEGKNIFEAISDLVKSKEDEVPKTRLKFSGKERPIVPRLEVGIFRIIQEAYNNALQHSNATEIFIQITNNRDDILFSIEDNGIGFSQSNIPTNKFGLIGIQERVRLLNGEIKMFTAKNSGSRIEVQIPKEYHG